MVSFIKKVARGVVSIPADIREVLRIREGDFIELTVRGVHRREDAIKLDGEHVEGTAGDTASTHPDAQPVRLQ